MQGKHIVMLAGENLIAGLYNEGVDAFVQTLAGVVRVGRRFF